MMENQITPGIFLLIFYGHILHVLFVWVLQITLFVNTQQLNASKYSIHCTLQYLSQSPFSLAFPILIYTNPLSFPLSREIDTAVQHSVLNLLTASLHYQ